MSTQKVNGVSLATILKEQHVEDAKKEKSLALCLAYVVSFSLMLLTALSAMLN